MAFELWSQTNFSKGELSPYMFARSDTTQYFNGLRTAQNVLTYPTGAAGKRFGTLFDAILNPDLTTADNLFFQTFQYLNECVYQLVFRPLYLDIYLEGILVADSISTGLDGVSVFNLANTVLSSVFRVSGQGFKPYDLSRSPGTPNTIMGFDSASGVFIMTTALTPGIVVPIRFTNAGGALPTTDPQIKIGVTYFANNISTSQLRVYSTSYDAKFDLNRYSINSGGTGTNNVVPQNSWTFQHVSFTTLPVYDFNGGYNSITFTPSAVSGSSVTLTASAPIFSAAFVGGAFVGNGGVSRILAFTDSTHVTIAVVEPFNDTNAISGQISFLAEPAWSDARGWPQKCSSYQNRSIFCNSDSLPNGFWASAINDYTDFDDLQTDDDNAISWFPTSDDINFIRFIVPYRSITVHTNSGIYSSPLSDVSAITPANFSLQLQDSTPADVLQPRAIDNQIIVISGDDVHTMLWDGINNAYTSDIVSVVSEQLIRNPADEDAFADLHRAGSRYVIIVNGNGSLAIYQTLLSQNVGGFIPAISEQSYGSAQFRQVATSSNGRCWFIVERERATALSPINITAFTSSTLTAVSSFFSKIEPTAITFTTTGSLPASSPALNTTSYFWAIGVTNDTFKVYLNQQDAIDDVESLIFTSAGTNSHVVPWPLQSFFTLEELTQDTRLDCAVYFNGSPTNSISTGTLFNAQSVKMVGDGYGFEANGFGNAVSFKAHGQSVNVSTGYIGYPIKLIIEPMPLTSPSNYNSAESVLVRPKHVRFIKFMFNNTIGGYINGVPIALNRFNMANIGQPPLPSKGIFEMGNFDAWDDFNDPVFSLTHDDPFDIQLLGVFYGVDV